MSDFEQWAAQLSDALSRTAEPTKEQQLLVAQLTAMVQRQNQPVAVLSAHTSHEVPGLAVQPPSTTDSPDDQPTAPAPARLCDLMRHLIQVTEDRIQQQRSFTPLPTLNHWTDLAGWDARLRVLLARHHLTRFVDEDVPAPEGEDDHKRWWKDRCDIDYLIADSIKRHELWDQMKALG